MNDFFPVPPVGNSQFDRSHGKGRRVRPSAVVACALVAGVPSIATVVAKDPPAGSATELVTNCNDSGPGSLRAMIAAAASGDTIGFTTECPASTPIKLGSTLDITAQDLTIEGRNAGSVVVDGGGHTAFYVNGMNVTVSGLTVTDSDSAFYNDKNTGLLTVIGSTLSQNNADTDGGGINFLNGSVTVEHSDITGNTASNAGGGIAIDKNGKLNIVNSTISNNSGAVGSGLVNNLGTVTLSDSTVSSNGGEGGGIVNEGGTLYLQDSTIADNQGGGLFNTGTT